MTTLSSSLDRPSAPHVDGAPEAGGAAGPGWAPSVALPPREIIPPVRRSWGCWVARAFLPYFVVYLAVGMVLVRWGGTDSSQGNVSFAWEWFTIPVWIALYALLGVPLALLSWAWSHLRRVLHLAPAPSSEPVTPRAAPPPPTSFSAKSQLRPERRRGTGPEGTLVLDDESISFTTARRRHDVSIPWSSVTTLQLRPRIAWGRGQRGHLTIGVRSGRPVDVMLPRPHYDKLAALLGAPAV